MCPSLPSFIHALFLISKAVCFPPERCRGSLYSSVQSETTINNLKNCIFVHELDICFKGGGAGMIRMTKAGNQAFKKKAIEIKRPSVYDAKLKVTAIHTTVSIQPGYRNPSSPPSQLPRPHPSISSFLPHPNSQSTCKKSRLFHLHTPPSPSHCKPRHFF